MMLEYRKLFIVPMLYGFVRNNLVIDGLEEMCVVDKKVVVLCLVCVVLAVGLVGALMLLNQKDAELQIKTNQISELENDKLGLAVEVSTLQYNISDLQSETVSLTNEKASLQTQVSGLQTEVTVLETQKGALETQVSVLDNNISGLQNNVTSLTNEKASLQTQVSGLQTEVTLLEGDKTALEEQVSSLQTQVTSLTAEVADLEVAVNSGYDSGYDDGFVQGVDYLIQTGYYSMDPTYDEAIAFIDSDETDENAYTPDYVCYDFTADFVDNAAQVGYRCGFVYIEFANSAHAIACFNTTDLGLIFVEPQNDAIVDVGVGQIYLGHVIVKMGIIW
jgi:peptidoglycan hydrolase CwlO-like protein